MNPLVKLSEDFDRQQAFAVGFALAARDAGLSEGEYEDMCKIAAARKSAAEEPQKPVVPENANQVAMAKRENFVAEKANAVRKTTPASNIPALPAVKAAAAAPAPKPAYKPELVGYPEPTGEKAVVPPGESAFDPKWSRFIADNEKKTMPAKDYATRRFYDASANLDLASGMAPATAATRMQIEADARARAAGKARTDQVAAAKANTNKLRQSVEKLPDPKLTSPGSLSPSLYKSIQRQ